MTFETNEELEYTLVEHWSATHFKAAVNQMLAAGWRLVGGVSVQSKDNGTSGGYVQAMSRPRRGTPAVSVVIGTPTPPPGYTTAAQ